MARQTMVGMFDTESAAQRARMTLLEAGIREDGIALSADLSEDAMASEAPGQSYENQPGQTPDDSTRAGFSVAVSSGVRVLSVKAGSYAEGKHIEQLMRQNGARRTTWQRDA